MPTRFLQLKEALEQAGFKAPEPEKKSVDDGDFDDDYIEHVHQERRRLFST